MIIRSQWFCKHSAFFTEKRKDARKRKKQREKDAERGEGGADADEMAADDELLSQVTTKFHLRKRSRVLTIRLIFLHPKYIFYRFRRL